MVKAGIGVIANSPQSLDGLAEGDNTYGEFWPNDSTTILNSPVWNTPSIPQVNNGLSPFWQSIISGVANTGSSVVKAQYGQPNINPGTYIKNADGSIMYALPTNSNNALSSNPFGSSGTGNLFLYGGIALVGLFILSKMGK